MSKSNAKQGTVPAAGRPRREDADEDAIDDAIEEAVEEAWRTAFALVLESEERGRPLSACLSAPPRGVSGAGVVADRQKCDD